MNANHYAVTHLPTMKSVRWGLTLEGAEAVLAELGAEDHAIGQNRLLGWAVYAGDPSKDVA